MPIEPRGLTTTSLTSEQLAAIQSGLPEGETAIGGMVLPSVVAEFDAAGDSSIVIWAHDDGTIHQSTIVQTGPNSYEITDDKVIGHWLPQ